MLISLKNTCLVLGVKMEIRYGSDATRSIRVVHKAVSPAWVVNIVKYVRSEGELDSASSGRSNCPPGFAFELIALKAAATGRCSQKCT